MNKDWLALIDYQIIIIVHCPCIAHVLPMYCPCIAHVAWTCSLSVEFHPVAHKSERTETMMQTDHDNNNSMPLHVHRDVNFAIYYIV